MVDVARTILRATIGAGPDLVLPATRSIGGRTIVRFAQAHEGIPVVAHGASVLFDERANPLLVAVSVASNFPPSTPNVAAPDAAATLLFAEVAGSMHLVHRVALKVAPTAPSRPFVYFDAHDGRVLQQFDRAAHAGRTLAYRTNPIASPTLETFELPLLPAGETLLRAPSIEARTCVDRKTVRTFKGTSEGLMVHVCDLEHLAVADAMGDFLVPATSDAFAETQGYFHAAQAASFVRALGFDEMPKVEVVAEVRWPPGWTTNARDRFGCASCELEPMANAFYTPPDSSMQILFDVKGEAIWLGRGRARSFAVDGDIVFHEYAHAVQQHTLSLVATPRIDDQGVVFAAGSANEAIADYFASAIGGDARIGEWAAGETSGEGPEIALRDLEGDARCASALSGEVHGDSLVLSQALIRVRRAQPSEAARHVFDRALLTAMIASPTGDLSWEELARLLLSTADTSVASALKSELERRGVLPRCDRTLDLTAFVTLRAAGGRGFVAPGRRTAGVVHTRVPPVVLLRHRIGAPSLTLSLRDLATTIDAARPRLVIRYDDPIGYDATGARTAGAIEIALTEAGGRLRATIAPPTGAQVLHVAVEGEGTNDGRWDEVLIEESVRPPSLEAGGGGCSVGPSSPATPSTRGDDWTSTLVLVALAVGTRRLHRARDS